MPIKIFSVPDTIPAPNYQDARVDGKYSIEKANQLEEAYMLQVEKYLRESGYTGKRTGKLWRYGVADGHATYMVAERAGSIMLVHLPLGDAWHIPEPVRRGTTQADIRAYVDAPRLFGETR